MEQKLTVWETKERAGLITLETEKWRQRRLIAEDPNTTADVLDQLADGAQDSPKGGLLAAAIAGHVNARPQTVLQVLESHSDGWVSSYHAPAFRAFCQNPVTPFLPLEIPDIWHTFSTTVCQRLLREPDLPKMAVEAFCHNIALPIPEEAHLHIAIAGELPIGREGEKVITNFWKAACLTNFEPFYDYCPADWGVQLAKQGLLPYWAAEMDMNGTVSKSSHQFPKSKSARSQRRSRDYGPPPNSCDELLWAVRTEQLVPAFARFAALLHRTYAPQCVHWSEHWGRRFKMDWGSDDVYYDYLHRQRGSMDMEWMARFHDALRLPLTDEPFTSDAWNRSPLDLLRHLARDGNQWVRWAAQTRLADPAYTFTWHETTH